MAGNVLELSPQPCVNSQNPATSSTSPVDQNYDQPSSFDEIYAKGIGYPDSYQYQHDMNISNERIHPISSNSDRVNPAASQHRSNLILNNESVSLLPTSRSGSNQTLIQLSNLYQSNAGTSNDPAHCMLPISSSNIPFSQVSSLGLNQVSFSSNFNNNRNQQCSSKHTLLNSTTQRTPYIRSESTRTSDQVIRFTQSFQTKKASDPVKPNFQTSHRRVRSGDSYIWNNPKTQERTVNIHKGRQNINPISNCHQPLRITFENQTKSPIPHMILGSSSGIYDPISRPQLESMVSPNRFRYVDRPLDKLHQIPLPMNNVTSQNDPNKTPLYFSQVHSFVKLNEAIEKVEKDVEILQQDLLKKEKDLDSSSADGKNPTKRDYDHLLEENRYLMKEIDDMFAEMQSMDIPFPGDPPANTSNNNFDKFEFTDPDDSLTKPFFPEIQNKKIDHRINVAWTEQPPLPNNSSSLSSLANIPEKWRCRFCTFDNNVYLDKCEICEKPR